MERLRIPDSKARIQKRQPNPSDIVNGNPESLTDKSKLNLSNEKEAIKVDLRYSKRLKSAVKYGEAKRLRRGRGPCGCSSDADRPCPRRSCPVRRNQGRRLFKAA